MRNGIELKYGMKICGFVHAYEMILGGLGITSSNSPTVYAEFTVEKYWPDDTNPMSYKVCLLPTAKYYGIVPKQTFYSSDLCSMIMNPYKCMKGSFMLKKDILPNFIIEYFSDNAKRKNGKFTIYPSKETKKRFVIDGYELERIEYSDEEYNYDYKYIRFFFKKYNLLTKKYFLHEFNDPMGVLLDIMVGDKLR